MNKFEVIRIAGPAYIPAILVGISTISCIFGANILNRRQQVTVASAYALMNQSYKEYQNKLIELYGKEADIEIRNSIVREHCFFHQIGIDVPDEKIMFYDEISGKYFIRYEREIMDAEYHLNRNFVMRGYASLNEFYEFLGLPQTDYGDTVGWSISDGYCWIDFEHRLVSRNDRGNNIYSINMMFPPNLDYLQ